MLSRRRLLLGAGGAGVTGAAVWTGLTRLQDDRELALVYRGPASCRGCSGSVARLLAGSNLRVQYCGPEEKLQVTAASLAEAQVYAQPGGGNLGPAWRHTRQYGPALRAFVAGGGTYLGFCLGAYLAGDDPGFGLFPGSVRQYITTEGATVTSAENAIVDLEWRGRRRSLFFQDGAAFFVPGGDWAQVGGQVLARYRNGVAAAVVTSYGAGRAGLVGPHPEADEGWYADAGLRNPDGIRFDLGHDLVRTALAR